MKKIEVVAIALIILWTVLLLYSSILSFISLADLYEPDKDASRFIDIGVMTVQRILYVVVQFGVAIWLFIQAKRDRTRSWVWGLFGLIFGIVAVVLYFLMQLIEQMKMKRTATEGDS